MSANKALVAHVSTEKAERFAKLALRLNTSQSKLLGSMVDKVLDSNQAAGQHGADSEQLPPATGTKEEKLSIRVNDRMKADVQVRAEKSNMTTSSYVNGLIRAHLSQQPFFTDIEMGALNQASNELTAIGRNINRIAKMMHISSGGMQANDLVEVARTVKVVRDEVRNLIVRNLRAWGVGDHEAN